MTHLQQVHPVEGNADDRYFAADGADRRQTGNRRQGAPVVSNAGAMPTPPISKRLLAAFKRRGTERCFAARTLVLQEQDASSKLFVILDGKVKTYATSRQGRDVVYQILGAGEMFGELSLDGAESTASVMTLERTSCVLIAHALVPELMAEFPEFGHFLIGKLINRLRLANASIKLLALGSTYQRLAHLLEAMDHTETREGRKLNEPVTQQALAERIGCSREMVSRMLLRMRKAGHIRIHSQRIVLLNVVSEAL